MSTEPRKVWAVEEGEYSDYRVQALFEREEDAEAARAAGLGDGVTSFTYYPAGAPGPVKVSGWRAFATLWPDGGTQEPSAYPADGWSSDEFAPPRRVRLGEHHLPRGRVRIEAIGRTQMGVIKAVADRLAKLRAERLEATS